MKLKIFIALLGSMVVCSVHALLDFQTEGVSARWTGRFLADVAWYDRNSSILLGDGTQVRSLRLGAKGDLCPYCEYKAEVDFARGDVSIRNALVSFHPTGHAQISIGHFKPPVSLEFLTSSLHISFLERALPNAFVTGRRLGVAMDFVHDLNNTTFYTLSLGGFGESANEDHHADNEGYNLSARATLSRKQGQRCLWVGGTSLSYTRFDSDNLVRYRSRPESSVTATRLVDTGAITSAKDSWLLVGELAFRFGRWSLQGEYFHNDVSRRNDTALSFNGYYVYTSFFITEDRRPFSKTYSKFNRVNPHLPYGAIELGVRYSYLNLNDQDIQGGHEHNVTAGCNWYLNSHLRFMANIIRAEATRKGIMAKPMIYTARAQYDF